MVPLNFLLLLPITLAAEREWNFGEYFVTTENNTLKNVKCNPYPFNNDLNLSNLGLKNVAINAFTNKSCSRVRNLNLNNNWLSTLPAFALKNFQFLKHLSIANNEITDIEESAFFTENSPFRSVNISNNRLTQLKKHQFFVSSTRKIDIYTQGNKITNISSRLFMDPKEYQDRDNVEITDLPSTNGSIFVEFCISRSIVNNERSDRIDENQPPCRIIEVAEEYKPRKQSGSKEDTFHCQEIEIQHTGGELDLLNFDIGKCVIDRSTLNGSLIKSIIVKIDSEELSLATQLLNDLPKNFEKAFVSSRYVYPYNRSPLITNKHLRELIFKNIEVNMNEPNLFRNMNLSVLKLHEARLNNLTFMAILPSSITELYLSKNTFEVIPAECFSNLKHFLKLSLSGNYIRKIEAGSLRGFSSLQFLDLSDNYLTTLETGTFQDLASLKNLNLRGNRIHLYKGIFTGLESIEVLNLADNSLTEITNNTLYAMPDTLKTVILDGNEIRTLNKDSFIRVPKHTLSLAENNIEKINKGSFNLPTLKRLSLAKNNLLEVNVESLSNLESLNLSGNPMKRLDHGALFGLNPMGKECIIEVSGTPIEFIDKRLFEPNVRPQSSDNHIIRHSDHHDWN